MEILDNDNFHQKVVEGNTSYVVEFYNAFCGHCIRFSTPWKEFGIEIYGKQLFFPLCLFVQAQFTTYMPPMGVVTPLNLLKFNSSAACNLK